MSNPYPNPNPASLSACYTASLPATAQMQILYLFLPQRCRTHSTRLCPPVTTKHLTLTPPSATLPYTQHPLMSPRYNKTPNPNPNHPNPNARIRTLLGSIPRDLRSRQSYISNPNPNPNPNPGNSVLPSASGRDAEGTVVHSSTVVETLKAQWYYPRTASDHSPKVVV